MGVPNNQGGPTENDHFLGGFGGGTTFKETPIYTCCLSDDYYIHSIF